MSPIDFPEPTLEQRLQRSRLETITFPVGQESITLNGDKVKQMGMFAGSVIILMEDETIWQVPGQNMVAVYQPREEGDNEAETPDETTEGARDGTEPPSDA